MFRAFVIICVLLDSGITLSQESVFGAGIIGGLTTAQIHGDAIGGFNKIGFNFGGFVNVDLASNFSTEFDMYVINKGSRKNPSKWDPSYWTIRLNYIEIPFLIRYKYKKITAELGLSYGRLINQKFLANGLEYTPDRVRYFNKNEYSGIAGVQYQMKSNLSLNLRYSQSMWKVRSFTFTYPRYYIFAWQAGSANAVISLSLKYQFGKKT